MDPEVNQSAPVQESSSPSPQAESWLQPAPEPEPWFQCDAKVEGGVHTDDTQGDSSFGDVGHDASATVECHSSFDSHDVSDFINDMFD
jgi:hypothetical protein